MAAGILDELRPVNYKAAGTLQRGLESLTRGEFDGLLDAMIRAGLVEIENAEYEKDGQVLRFRKVRSTEAGLEFHAAERASLLVADGLADEFRAGSTGKARAKKKTSAVSKPAKTADASIPAPLGPRDQELAARLREWRSAEAKRLRVPAFMVMHERTLRAIAQAQPETPRQLLHVKGMGETKVEKFGEAILEICRDR